MTRTTRARAQAVKAKGNGALSRRGQDKVRRLERQNLALLGQNQQLANQCTQAEEVYERLRAGIREVYIERDLLTRTLAMCTARLVSSAPNEAAMAPRRDTNQLSDRDRIRG